MQQQLEPYVMKWISTSPATVKPVVRWPRWQLDKLECSTQRICTLRGTWHSRSHSSHFSIQIKNRQILQTRRTASSGMLRRVALVRTDVSEELSTSFIRVTRIGELGTTLSVTNNRCTQRRSERRLLVTASVVPSSPILVTLMKRDLSS
jgi:hypothetical protein